MNVITRSASFLLALLVLFPSFSQAQQVPYEVTFVAMDEESGERLRMAKSLLENALETRGAHQSGAGRLFLIVLLAHMRSVHGVVRILEGQRPSGILKKSRVGV